MALRNAGRWGVGAVGAGVAALATWDLLQKKHTILRRYPVVGHLRYLMEDIRPELQQYFIERDWDGRPYSRDTRALIYERAKGVDEEKPYGTELDVNRIGHEHLVHSTTPLEAPDEPSRVMVGGPDCSRPYSMALLNVSAMSFGALSANAIRALNKGAALGGFAHDTGEGGLSPYHLEHGGDIVWEIGTGYFGARTDDGDFDPEMFRETASKDQVKTVSLKLSQGAKPGVGGVLPGAKVTQEIADTRRVPVGVKCVSPPSHKVFSTPTELIEFVARMRELAGGKPAGFKLCVGSRVDVLAICKAITEVGTAPDFIIVDGSEGGTGAAPLEFEDHVGMSLTEGLMTVHNALVGAGLRDTIRIGASGKVAGAGDLVKRLTQGADYTNAARAMMMAAGCIQAQRCHTDKCPSGVATQNARRARALDVEDKSERVHRYQRATVDEAMRLMAAMGVRDPAELTPAHLRRNESTTETRSYAEIYEWLAPGELLDQPPSTWARDWALASPDHFGGAR
ncbi:Glutamate synthase domain-containing protein 2 [Paraoerskovia marina]|uniref:Glutamate synthase domain-containing protein 2 n=1 Tax=Paraoerskovia marina TaxID=545619 RepID=A0A1H1MY28_9CELL|nr:FMN-binding glutamate synthase family protein [Paraoerskovia marina]SDR91498.1 Glutamate synthase domain-containing protein 2 [Paraoerskovia marina]